MAGYPDEWNVPSRNRQYSNQPGGLATPEQVMATEFTPESPQANHMRECPRKARQVECHLKPKECQWEARPKGCRPKHREARKVARPRSLKARPPVT
jgi:hypothetical protein